MTFLDEGTATAATYQSEDEDDEVRFFMSKSKALFKTNYIVGI